VFVSRIRRKAEAVALFAMLCAFASPAHAWHLFGQNGSPHATEERPPSNDQGADERRQRRAEHQQLRDELRDRQREGLAPTGGGWEQDDHGHRMSPEERRQFRRDIDDAGRQIYGPKRGSNR